MENITKESKKPASYPTIGLAKIFVYDNNMSFDVVGDEMPA